MKRVLVFILIWGLLVVTGSIVSANSQTRLLRLPAQATSPSLSADQLNSADYSETIRTTTEAN